MADLVPWSYIPNPTLDISTLTYLVDPQLNPHRKWYWVYTEPSKTTPTFWRHCKHYNIYYFK